VLLEIACFNIESALIAARAGADRIELCADYNSGGLTPSEKDIRSLRQKIDIPIVVMIRPRAGNFIYSNEEVEAMRRSIVFCKITGMDGVVFGILTAGKNVDVERCRQLADLAEPMKATFHRAIDETGNIHAALEDIIACGFNRILTSGQERTALDGAEVISELIKNADGRITVMAGGGIRSNNIAEVNKRSGAKEFHSAALKPGSTVVDEEEVRKLKAILSR
jgi:copper homeostasis protein